MNTLEKFVAGALGLIALYLVFSARSETFRAIGGTAGGLFGVLQGRDVDFGNDVSIKSNGAFGYGR